MRVRPNTFLVLIFLSVIVHPFWQLISLISFLINWKVWKLIRLLIVFHDDYLSDIFSTFLYLANSLCYLQCIFFWFWPSLILYSRRRKLRVHFQKSSFSKKFDFSKINCLTIYLYMIIFVTLILKVESVLGRPKKESRIFIFRWIKYL